jgi:hypothetical protein
VQDWVARRAAKAWTQTVAAVAATAADPAALSAFRLTTSARSRESWRSAAAAQENAIAQEYLRLVLEVMSQRSWSQSLHSETLPDLWAGVLNQSNDLAYETLLKCRRVVTTIQQAVAAVPEVPELAQVLKDVGFHKHQLNADFAELAELSGWFPFRDQQLRMLARHVFVGPMNTKSHLEDLFNSLRDAQRANRNKAVSRWRRYDVIRRHQTTATLPNLPFDGGCVGPVRVPGVHPGTITDSMFAPGNHQPTLDLTPLRAKGGGWRAAGFQGNNRAVAGTQLLQQLASVNFQGAGDAWQGALPLPALCRAWHCTDVHSWCCIV